MIQIDDWCVRAFAVEYTEFPAGVDVAISVLENADPLYKFLMYKACDDEQQHIYIFERRYTPDSVRLYTSKYKLILPSGTSIMGDCLSRLMHYADCWITDDVWRTNADNAKLIDVYEQVSVTQPVVEDGSAIGFTQKDPEPLETKSLEERLQSLEARVTQLELIQVRPISVPVAPAYPWLSSPMYVQQSPTTGEPPHPVYGKS